MEASSPRARRQEAQGRALQEIAVRLSELDPSDPAVEKLQATRNAIEQAQRQQALQDAFLKNSPLAGTPMRRKQEQAPVFRPAKKQRQHEELVMWKFSCPRCRAKIGEPCTTASGNARPLHASRMSKARPPTVRMVRGGGVESNRRRH